MLRLSRVSGEGPEWPSFVFAMEWSQVSMEGPMRELGKPSPLSLLFMKRRGIVRRADLFVLLLCFIGSALGVV